MVSAQSVQKVKAVIDHIQEPFLLIEAVLVPAGRDDVLKT